MLARGGWIARSADRKEKRSQDKADLWQRSGYLPRHTFGRHKPEP